jgi:hypothetical protein
VPAQGGSNWAVVSAPLFAAGFGAAYLFGFRSIVARVRISMRKALCSIGVGPHVRLLELARPTFEDYAQRHGYQLITSTSLVDEARPPSWSKIPLLRNLLQTYDVVLWIDSDALIVDPSRDIADELEADRFLYLVEHHFDDSWPRAEAAPNGGVLLVRSGPDADEFLETVWNSSDFVNSEIWEQAAIMRLLGYSLDPWRHERRTKWSDKTKFLSNAWNSSVVDQAPHPRIMHFAGYSLPLRIVQMRLGLLCMRLGRRPRFIKHEWDFFLYYRRLKRKLSGLMK